MAKLRKTVELAVVWFATAMAVAALAAGGGVSTAANNAFLTRTKPSDPGAPIFAAHCAVCHAHAVNRAPAVSILGMMSPTAIERALTVGAMRLEARTLSEPEKRSISEYLSGRKSSAQNPGPQECSGRALRSDEGQRPELAAWGIEPENSRFIAASTAGTRQSERQAPSSEMGRRLSRRGVCAVSASSRR